MCHMAAIFARHTNERSFDERADIGDLPQDRLAPRHEPVLAGFCAIHTWTVYIRANNATKKSACDNFFLPQAPQDRPSQPVSPSIQPPPTTPEVRRFRFSEDLCWIVPTHILRTS